MRMSNSPKDKQLHYIQCTKNRQKSYNSENGSRIYTNIQDFYLLYRLCFSTNQIKHHPMICILPENSSAIQKIEKLRPQKTLYFPQIIQIILFGVHSAWKQQYDIEDRKVTPKKIRYKSAICDLFPVNLHAVQKIEKSAETRRGPFFPKSHSLELSFLVLRVLCQSLRLSSPTCDEAVAQIWLYMQIKSAGAVS